MKYCRDCIRKSGFMFWDCLEFPEEVVHGDPVTGKGEIVTFSSCRKARTREDMCGKWGKKFRYNSVLSIPF